MFEGGEGRRTRPQGKHEGERVSLCWWVGRGDEREREGGMKR